MHMVVNTLVKTLYQGQPELVVKVLDYVMGLTMAEFPSQKEYTDALKTFEGARLGEMHRIAITFSDYLLVRIFYTGLSMAVTDNVTGYILRLGVPGQQHDPIQSQGRPYEMGSASLFAHHSVRSVCHLLQSTLTKIGIVHQLWTKISAWKECRPSSSPSSKHGRTQSLPRPSRHFRDSADLSAWRDCPSTSRRAITQQLQTGRLLCWMMKARRDRTRYT